MGNIFGVQKIEQSAAVAVGSNNSVNYDDIPGDLIVEILSKLPVKSLTRFKSVCKAWKLLINSQVFINTHLHANNPRFRGLSLRGKNKSDFLSPSETGLTFGTCNGIICLQAGRLVLFNPSTGESSYVPPQLCASKKFGFCYLPKTQEYQIVFFPEQLQYKKVIDSVTTLTLGKTPSSRVTKNISLPGQIISLRHATSGTTMFFLGIDDSKSQIVIFYDVVEEKFGAMNAPPSPSPPPSNVVRRYLGLLKGSVIMFENFLYNSTFFDIWMLIEDVSNGKSWMKYRRVGPLCNIFGTPKGVYPLEVCWDDRWILCRKHDNLLASNGFLALNDSRDLFFYDLNTNQVEDYCKIQKDREEDPEGVHEPIIHFLNYQESLVSINSLVPYIDHERPKNIH